MTSDQVASDQANDTEQLFPVDAAAERPDEDDRPGQDQRRVEDPANAGSEAAFFADLTDDGPEEDFLPAPSRGLRLRAPTAVLAMLATLAAGFLIGAVVQSHDGKGTTTTGRRTLAAGFTGTGGTGSAFGGAGASGGTGASEDPAAAVHPASEAVPHRGEPGTREPPPRASSPGCGARRSTSPTAPAPWSR